MPKITLGKEKVKTKVLSNTLNPKWREAFDLNWYEELDDFIDIALFDHDVGGKDDRMGRVEIDLRDLTREVSHNLWRPIKDGEGSLNVIITITGTTKHDSPSNLANWNPDPKEEQELIDRYVKVLTQKQISNRIFLENSQHLLQHEGRGSFCPEDHKSPGSSLGGSRW